MMPESAAAAVKDISSPETIDTYQRQQLIAGCIKTPPTPTHHCQLCVFWFIVWLYDTLHHLSHKLHNIVFISVCVQTAAEEAGCGFSIAPLWGGRRGDWRCNTDNYTRGAVVVELGHNGGGAIRRTICWIILPCVRRSWPGRTAAPRLRRRRRREEGDGGGAADLVCRSDCTTREGVNHRPDGTMIMLLHLFNTNKCNKTTYKSKKEKEKGNKNNINMKIK